MGKPKHTGKWKCLNGCGKEFIHKQSLYNHQVSCVKGKISCSKCKRTFSRTSYLKIHKCIIKSKTCIICNKEFKRKWFLDCHIETVHNTEEKKIYSCEGCQREYKKKNHFVAHIAICIGETSNQSKEFEETVVLRAHLNN